MARAQGSRAQMALAYESTYGTAPATGFFTMPFVSSDLSTEQPLLDSELLGYGRDPLAPQRDAIKSDGKMVLPVDCIATGHWLKGLLGAPVTTGTTPKTHTYTSGALTIPSMSIEIGTPEVPYFDMFSGACVDSIMFKLERSGLLQMTAGLVAQGNTPNAATQAGTQTAIAVQRFGHFNGSIKRDTVSLGNMVSAEFTYSNNLDRIETIRNDGKIDGVDPTIASLGGSLTGRFADTVLLDQAISGAPCSLEFAWTISASLSLVLTAHAVYLPRPKRSIDGPDGLKVSFDWQAAKATSPARMFTAVLVNAQASY